MTPHRFNIEVDDGDIDVEVRWNSRRKSRMGILFDPDGGIVVDAPPGTALDEVRALLAAHKRWLRYRSRTASAELGTWYPRAYEQGVLIFFRGNPYSLRLATGRKEVILDGETLLVRGNHPRDAKAQVWDWYRTQAPSVLGGIVEHMSAALPWVEDVPGWRHRYMKSQWGSCTGSSRISLNTHLVKLTDDLIEYVVLHEMCHLMYLNHGPRFYRLMETYMPDWKERRRQLNRFVGVLAEPLPGARG